MLGLIRIGRASTQPPLFQVGIGTTDLVSRSGASTTTPRRVRSAEHTTDCTVLLAIFRIKAYQTWLEL